MSGFTANAPGSTPSAVAPAVDGDGWYPALTIAHFRAAHRIEDAVTSARVRDALLAGFVSAAVALVRWRDEQEAAGVRKLEDATIRGRPAGDAGGEPLALIHWRRAVYASAAATIADTHHDVTATKDGRDLRDERASGADELRRDATMALRDLMGRGRSKLALI